MKHAKHTMHANVSRTRGKIAYLPPKLTKITLPPVNVQARKNAKCGECGY